MNDARVKYSIHIDGRQITIELSSQAGDYTMSAPAIELVDFSKALDTAIDRALAAPSEE